MNPVAKTFLQRWAINTLAVLVATSVVKGITYDSVVGLLVASLLLGVLNAVLRPLLIILSLPLVIFTLGLFTLVINAFLLLFVSWLVEPFHVSGFWAAFWGGLIISLVSLVANTMTGTGESKVEFRRHKPRSRDHHDDGKGPVIDV